MTPLAIPAIDDGALLLIPRGWSQWQRQGIRYRQYPHDDQTTTVLAWMDGAAFVLLLDNSGRLTWSLTDPVLVVATGTPRV